MTRDAAEFRSWRSARQWAVITMLAGGAIVFGNATGAFPPIFPMAEGCAVLALGALLGTVGRYTTVGRDGDDTTLTARIRVAGRRVYERTTKLHEARIVLHATYGRGGCITATLVTPRRSIILGEGGAEVIEAAAQTRGVPLSVSRAFLERTDPFDRRSLPQDTPVLENSA